MTEPDRRVALLVRPGVAGDRLRELLAEAGIESVLQGDPTELAAEALAESGPQVVLVALDPETEDALERFDAVLGNPDVDVIYEEAELAAVREGWEAARWKRHLLAKLQGHDRVLPPRPDGSTDSDAEPLQLQGVTEISDEAFHAFDPSADAAPTAAEMLEDRPSVPDPAAISAADLTLEPELGAGELSLEPYTPESAEPALSVQADDFADAGLSLDESTGIELEEPASEEPVSEETGSTRDELSVDAFTDSDTGGIEDDAANVIELDAGEFQYSTGSFDPAQAEAEEAAGNEGNGFEITFDLAEMDDSAPAAVSRDSDEGLEAHLESLIRASSAEVVDSDDDVADASADTEATTTADIETDDKPPAPAGSGSVFGDLSLDDSDTVYVAAQAKATDERFGRDLAALDERISTLELVDDSAERADALSGAVLVMAGIGGPDAVRQLLGALPTDFSRPVLVQQRLDGGRYDRLVAQMQRATTLPVHLAEPGKPAMAGFIYMLPAGLGIKAGKDGMRFDDEGEVLAALPAADSAVILLSGSDPADVDQALKHHADGALVAGQAAEGCYDASASDQLVARGGVAGQPAELAQRLAQRWPA